MTGSSTILSAFGGEAERLAEHLERSLVAVRSGAGGGSGTAWGPWLVVTNHHVVPGESATVVAGDGAEYEARVVSRDAANDLALLRIDAALVAARPGDSRAVRAGQLVFAIGNPWGQRGTLTAGVVLAPRAAKSENPAQIRDAIRADLRLAPGNSGGPLADADGRVVGINSMISGGMAVAVPQHTVAAFVARSEPAERGYLGVTVQPVFVPGAIAAAYRMEDAAALMLTGIEAGSPAERAGLLPGDIVLAAGEGQGLRQVSGALQGLRAGRPLTLSLLRGGELVKALATPAARN